ncbi:MAG TPA: hypothetical protein VMK16_00220 [Acidimicrobiales bacterium]|nr:hypothetical protein [Acidimicrobiales bacterium]
MKRIIAVSALALAGLAVGAAPAGALTQSNTAYISGGHRIAIANSGFNFSVGGTINTGPAIAVNVKVVVINQSNSNP